MYLLSELMYFLNPLERKFDGEAQAWARNGEKAPNCWGIGRWGHMEDFLPIPWLPIHPYSRGGEAVAGSGWGGQDSALSHKPGALKMAFISQGRARPQLG